MQITNLHQDIISSINLTIFDKLNLSKTCKYLYDILNDELHKLYHECHEEIQNEWNRMARNIMYNADIDIIYKESNVISYSMIPNKLHFLEVKYLRNTRDVDILSWYEDYNQIGYTML